MSNVKDLMLGVYRGEISAEDLSDEEFDAVIDGFRQVAEELVKIVETNEVGTAMLAAINEAEPDPFNEAIEAAESRGSTYWEFENDRLH